jgi:hypothetical protein
MGVFPTQNYLMALVATAFGMPVADFVSGGL